MSEGWPAQVVKETGVLGSDAAAEASHVAGKASEAVKGSAHAVQGTVTGVRHRLAPSIPLLHSPPPSPPPPPSANQIQSVAAPRPLFSHLTCMYSLSLAQPLPSLHVTLLIVPVFIITACRLKLVNHAVMTSYMMLVL